jgi:chromate transporter
VNLFVLYLLMLKATVTSFTGMGSLPMIRSDLVVERHVITDHQLNTAVVAGRAGPGPYGIYMVCVAYVVAGIPGAIVGFLAMVTPAFLIIPLMRWVSAHADNPRFRSMIQGVLLASGGLLLAASIPLARDAITGLLAMAIVVTCFGLLSFTRLDTAWLILGAALSGVAGKLLS